MHSLRERLKKHEILIFLFMTFLGTYLCWGVLWAASKGIINKDIFSNTVFYTFLRILGGSMPSIMGIILIGGFYGRTGLKELFGKLSKWKMSILFYLLVLFPINAQRIITYLICELAGMNVSVSTGSQYQSFKTNSILGIFILFLAIVLLGGPISEEFGWRGFLLPRLQNKIHPFFSAVIVGVIWSLWHVPMFFIEKTVYSNFTIYTLVTILLSIEITWMYNRTQGSLIFPILLHGLDNTYAVIIKISGSQMGKADDISYVVLTITSAILVMDMFRSSLRRRE